MDVVTLGEAIAEFYRKEVDKPLDKVGNFVGPYPAGAPAIFADSCAKLGCSCRFIGVIGKDEYGKLIKRKLEKDGVNLSKLRVTSRTTATSFVAYFKDGSRNFLFHLSNAAAGQLCSDDIDPSYISKAKILHIAGSTLSINESCRRAVYKAAKIAAKENVKISFDPNIRPELLSTSKIRKICNPILEKCYVLIPDSDEAKILADETDLNKAADKLLEKIDIVAIKMGKEGSLLVTKNRKKKIPPFSVKEKDPTGAGDAFDAGFICSLLKGKSPVKAARFANAVGALAVTERGGMEGFHSLREARKLAKN